MPLERPTLYGPALLDHARQPPGTASLEPSLAVRATEVDNPLCGDRVRLEVNPSDPQRLRLSHATRGCALCVASASIMAEAVSGQPVDAVRSMSGQITTALRDHSDAPLPPPLMPIFAALHTAPMRRSCVRLPWAALEDLLSKQDSPLTTRNE